MTGFSAAQLQTVDELLEQHSGSRPDGSRAKQVGEILQHRMQLARLRSAAEYLRRLQNDPDEMSALAIALTIGETYFFRTPQHFTTIENYILPRLRETGASEIRMLSAACASGEEPYSLAILMEEQRALHGPMKATIEAVDVNPAALARAREGIYTEWSLRSLNPGRRTRYFTAEGKLWRLEKKMRDAVRFHSGNLLSLPLETYPENSFDIVFCRNVFIYFTPTAMQQAVENLCHILKPGGYLFLGSAETLRGISRSFELCHLNDGFFYRKLSTPQLVAEPLPKTLSPVQWFEEIDRSAGRIQQMRPGTQPRKAVTKRKRTTDMGQVIALIAEDRKPEALAALLSMPDHLETQIARAALMLAMGRKADAARAARTILAADDLSAEAHYILSVCLEREDKETARFHGEAAAYLDSGFLMAQLRAGQMAARRKDWKMARRALRNARTAVNGEEARRITLFAGGFSREGLRAICETEWGNVEGKA